MGRTASCPLCGRRPLYYTACDTFGCPECDVWTEERHTAEWPCCVNGECEWFVWTPEKPSLYIGKTEDVPEEVEGVTSPRIKRVLFLDDNEERRVKARSVLVSMDVTTVTCYEMVCAALQQLDPFDLACLDHDLSIRQTLGLPTSYQDDNGRYVVEHTGYDVAKYIMTMAPERRPKKIIIHSHNVAGAKRMMDFLRDYGHPDVTLVPFMNWLK